VAAASRKNGAREANGTHRLDVPSGVCGSIRARSGWSAPPSTRPSTCSRSPRKARARRRRRSSSGWSSSCSCRFSRSCSAPHSPRTTWP